MGISFNITFQKKDLWLLSAIFVFLIGVGFVVAYDKGYSGAVPGSRASIMGHTANEIDGNLSGGGGALSCHFVKNTTASSITVTASCDSGVRTGGGCMVEPNTSVTSVVQGWSRWRRSMPLNPNGWLCKNEDGVGYNFFSAYVICCTGGGGSSESSSNCPVGAVTYKNGMNYHASAVSDSYLREIFLTCNNGVFNFRIKTKGCETQFDKTTVASCDQSGSHPYIAILGGKKVVFTYHGQDGHDTYIFTIPDTETVS